jgi:hypothetical protein
VSGLLRVEVPPYPHNGRNACEPLAELYDDPEPPPDVARQMRALCHRCPVLDSCQADAIADPSAPGFQGGLTKTTRARIRNRIKGGG